MRMRSKSGRNWLWMVIFCLFLLPLTAAGAEKKIDLVGKEAFNFTLPSTHDRLINYVDEYYGKHNLIITFFPAAFTPV
jgi:hypothetical protein